MKTRSRCGLWNLTIAGILAAGAVNTQTALAADIDEEVSVTPTRTISPTEEGIMARSAAHVLHHVVDARSAIHADNIDQAKRNLQQARSLIDSIRASQPTAKVRDHIWAAKQHLDYESTEEVAADLIPIEADLTEIESFVPVENARRHTRFARERLHKGDKEGAEKELKAADAALIYTEVDLPLTGTERQVIAAQNALDNNQPAQADKALEKAEDGVRFLSTAVLAPVTQARNSLWQATKEYAARNYAAAEADLATAGAWLKIAARSTDATTRQEAAALRGRMESLNGKLGQAEASTGIALTQLWRRSQALAEREAEKVSVEGGTVSGESAAKADLIDAKLHLAYAESAQFIAGKSAEAGDELDKAGDYLDKAAGTSDKELVAKIHAMSDELKQIKGNVDDKGAEARTRYEKLKADLRQTIRDL